MSLPPGKDRASRLAKWIRRASAHAKVGHLPGQPRRRQIAGAKSHALLIEASKDLDDVVVIGVGVDLVGDDFRLQDGVSDGVRSIEGAKEKLVARGQPLSERPLHGEALVAAAHPLEKHLCRHQQPVLHAAVQTTGAQVERVFDPLVLRREGYQKVGVGRGAIANSAAKQHAENRRQSLLPVEHEKRPGLDGDRRLGFAAPGDRIGRAQIPRPGGKRRFGAFPRRLPKEERAHRIRAIERVVQGSHPIGRPHETALQVRQVQPPVALQRGETGDPPGRCPQMETARLRHGRQNCMQAP
ncbi:MAG TPA: hypothetical protein VF881_17625 [Polyangiaceae bacterium]